MSSFIKVHLHGHDLIATETSSLESPVLSSFVSFYSYDGHGSVRALTNATGELEETYDYDAYGTLIDLSKRNPTTGELESSLITDNSHPITSFLFCGEYYDRDLGMIFLRARYLNPDTGCLNPRSSLAAYALSSRSS